ncbi:hypothetical protein [Nocardiopsis kunsanensis]|uniref:Lipoprotein n=1 Tax=Nocardiopsis kunsanensis TaxID=141693 RepID=A0A918X9P2_9ACTN|nr:hypothetical protein [Nocardiopsis kunsanensis]GHD19918.1 hypothetical protein GCM10007147_11300 [Nocardiopsis kunsanensis]
MGVRSTAALAPLAAVLLCGALASCSSGQEEPDATRAELERAAEDLSATALRPGAERAFASHGHPLSEGLVCSVEAPGSPSPSRTPSDSEKGGTPADGPAGDGPTFTAAPELGPTFTAAPEEEPQGYLMVVCTGRTEEGEEASFEATLPRRALLSGQEGGDGLSGEFVGRVDREELFSTDCLQCSDGGGPRP